MITDRLIQERVRTRRRTQQAAREGVGVVLQQNGAGMFIGNFYGQNKLIAILGAGTLAAMGGEEVVLRGVTEGKKILLSIFI